MTFSVFLRRTHMYLALFLSPWILMYTLSTFVMNHRAIFSGIPAQPPQWEKERELAYDGEFPAGAGTREIAMQLLASLAMEGRHAVRADGGLITINRQDPVNPRRITYTPSDRKVVVEKMRFRGTAFLERMHRRSGFTNDFFLDNVWGVLVDVVIVTIVFWAASGLWMWWELKVTRKLGALCLAGGIGLFALLVAVL